MMTKQQYLKLAREGATQFRQTYAALLVCYDTETLWQTLDAELSLGDYGLGNATKAGDFQKAMEHVFLNLLHRSALDSILVVEPLPEEAASQLTAMLKSAGYDTAHLDANNPALIAARKVEAEQQELLDDWNTLPSRSFRTKWFGILRRPVYDKAVAEGRL